MSELSREQQIDHKVNNAQQQYDDLEKRLTNTKEYTEWVASVWKANSERNK